MSEFEKVIADFIDASIKYGVSQEEGNSKLVNKSVKRIEKNYIWLKDNNELNNAIFIDLINHQNDYVRFHTAYSLLHIENDIAIKTLMMLTEKKGLIGLEAKMSIDEYKKGNI